jgi:hypothetical protein
MNLEIILAVGSVVVSLLSKTILDFFKHRTAKKDLKNMSYKIEHLQLDKSLTTNNEEIIKFVELVKKLKELEEKHGIKIGEIDEKNMTIKIDVPSDKTATNIGIAASGAGQANFN